MAIKVECYTVSATCLGKNLPRQSAQFQEHWSGPKCHNLRTFMNYTMNSMCPDCICESWA